MNNLLGELGVDVIDAVEFPWFEAVGFEACLCCFSVHSELFHEAAELPGKSFFAEQTPPFNGWHVRAESQRWHRCFVGVPVVFLRPFFVDRLYELFDAVVDTIHLPLVESDVLKALVKFTGIHSLFFECKSELCQFFWCSLLSGDGRVKVLFPQVDFFLTNHIYIRYRIIVFYLDNPRGFYNFTPQR